MNALTEAEFVALAKTDQRRLHRLAGLAGRSPKAMLKFVLQDGFDAVEQEVLETLAAEQDAKIHGTMAHSEVMRGSHRIIEEARARRQKKQLEWTRPARIAYDASISYIADDDPNTAQAVEARVAKSLMLLAAQPGMGTPGKLPGRRTYPIPRIGFTINPRVTADAIIIDRWYRQRQNVVM